MTGTRRKTCFVRLVDGRGAVLSPYGSDGDDAEPSSHDHVLPRVGRWRAREM